MLCPNCGTKTTTKHRFCRNCGMNLEPVSKALAEHRATGGAAHASEQRTVRRMTNLLFAGLAVVLFGILMIAFLPGRGFKSIGIMVSLVGIVIAVISVLAPLRSMRNADAEVPPDELDDATPTTGRLLHEQTFAPARKSVTDHTTELLNVELKDRKSPRDG